MGPSLRCFMSHLACAAGITPDADAALPSRPRAPHPTRRPLRARCTTIFCRGETSDAHAPVHHAALPLRFRYCDRQTVADHRNHQSGDENGDGNPNWPDSYSELGLSKRGSTAYAPHPYSHDPPLDHNSLHVFKRVPPLFVLWTSEAGYSSINKTNICAYPWCTKKW